MLIVLPSANLQLVFAGGLGRSPVGSCASAGPAKTAKVRRHAAQNTIPLRIFSPGVELRTSLDARPWQRRAPFVHQFSISRWRMSGWVGRERSGARGGG